MGVKDNFFEKNIKSAFSRVKEHIINIENELKSNKEEIIRLREEIRFLKEGKLHVEAEKSIKPLNNELKEVSSGNEGVYSFIHSFTKHSFNNYTHNVQGFKQDFDKIFGSLSQQEFLTFLTIYQLEEEIKNVGYLDVAKKLNLTEGCIRTYVSSLLKKGLPLIKEKHNNRQVFLHIAPEFRSLNLKQKLIDTFYHTDSNKKKLQESSELSLLDF